MENNCNCSNCSDKNRMEVAEQLMNILDEDGQPLYSIDWIEEHILGIEKQKSEL